MSQKQQKSIFNGLKSKISRLPFKDQYAQIFPVIFIVTRKQGSKANNQTITGKQVFDAAK
jgi:hypothetical protein